MSRSRRIFLRDGLAGMGVLATGAFVSGCRLSTSGRLSSALDEVADGANAVTGGTSVTGPTNGTGPVDTKKFVSNIGNVGPLQDPDANGMKLPEGFTSRVLATSFEQPVETSDYEWHRLPDGGATFATADGGWIYVSNSESSDGKGGVGALRFDAAGNVIDAYSILDGTTRNCAGGPTPWGTWLSCEEFADGITWECDPAGNRTAVAIPEFGVYAHEAAIVDPETGDVYLTEDHGEGGFYRFRYGPQTLNGLNPTETPFLAAEIAKDGVLQVAQVGPGNQVTWHDVPDPQAESTPTRDQVADMTPFDGGEGIWLHEGVVYFTTKGDNRIHAYDIDAGTLDVIYDAAEYDPAELTGVDNITGNAFGDLLVAEDGGDLQIVAITPGGKIVPLMQLPEQPLSEIAGPAFSPDGTRLYFSSQRGFGAAGITYEVTGPFHVPR